jgi:hypothetical protein
MRELRIDGRVQIKKYNPIVRLALRDSHISEHKKKTIKHLCIIIYRCLDVINFITLSVSFFSFFAHILVGTLFVHVFKKTKKSQPKSLVFCRSCLIGFVDTFMLGEFISL